MSHHHQENRMTLLYDTLLQGGIDYYFVGQCEYIYRRA